MYSYLDRLFIRVICGNQINTKCNLVQNLVQTWQFGSTIEYNQPTQNNHGSPWEGHGLPEHLYKAELYNLTLQFPNKLL